MIMMKNDTWQYLDLNKFFIKKFNSIEWFVLANECHSTSVY